MHCTFIRMYVHVYVSLSTIVLNSRERQGIYGFPCLKNNLTTMFPSNTGHLSKAVGTVNPFKQPKGALQPVYTHCVVRISTVPTLV